MKSTMIPLKWIIRGILFITALFIFIWAVGVMVTAVTDPTGDSRICTRCHSAADRILAHRGLKNKEIRSLPCLQCHDPHAAVASNTPLRRPDKNNCTACHYEYSPIKLDEQRGRGSVHNPVAHGNCIDCHSTHELGEKPRFQIPIQDLCISCHVQEAKKLSDSYQHLPFDQRQCTSCHNPHRSDYRKLLVMSEKRLCDTCHLDSGKSAALPYKHQPFAQKHCTSCHDPHASNNARQLTFPPKQLCYTCHPDRKQEQKKVIGHPPFVEGKCFECHSPHAAPGPKLVKAKTITGLCYQCHDGLRQDFLKPSHHPVGEQLECSGCHTPHAGDFRKLLVFEGNKLCFMCHQDKKWFYGRIGHGSLPGRASTGACRNCHQPHGSAYKPLLDQEELELCFSCHPAMGNSSFTHPVGQGYTDPDKGVPLTCSTTCHDPHGTANKFNVTKKGDALCLTCHSDKMTEK